MILKQVSEIRLSVPVEGLGVFSARVGDGAITLDHVITGRSADSVEKMVLLLLHCIGSVRQKTYTVTEVSLEEPKVYLDIMREGAVL